MILFGSNPSSNPDVTLGGVDAVTRGLNAGDIGGEKVDAVPV
jgi:hypothetical protein